MRHAYIIGFWPDYETFTLSVDLNPEFDLKLVNLKRTLEPRGWARGVRRYLQRFAYLRELAAQMRREPESIFLFQDNIRLLRMLEQLPAQRFRGGVLARDTSGASAVRKALVCRLASRGVRVWSFDEGDCGRHGFEFYPQFVRKIAAETDAELHSDLFFLGRNKGRAAILGSIRENAKAAGYVVDFTVFDTHGAPVGYGDYLKRMLRSRCLVEINQQGQSGYTMRAVEALLYGKKLITNNPAVLSIVGAAPENVLVINGVPSPSELRGFLEQPSRPPVQAAFETYEASAVMRRILRQAGERYSRL